ncbi:MAG: hypothetical protein ACTSSG_13745 [Candidatus Heimdallarchaeaceae archaeon]
MTVATRFKEENTGQYAIVYFSDNGFEILASNIQNLQLETSLIAYPTLMGIMQNQKVHGLATTKISKDLFLFAFAITVKNLDAKDHRLKKDTLSIINFLVSREIYKELMLDFDVFEDFLQNYFKPITFLFDLYAIDYTKIIPQYLERHSVFIEKRRQDREISEEVSLAVEFKRWLSQANFEK